MNSPGSPQSAGSTPPDGVGRTPPEGVEHTPPDNVEATQLLLWRPPVPPPPAHPVARAESRAHHDRYVRELDHDRNRRGMIVVVAVALLVVAALLLAIWLSAPRPPA
jgi:hypothetical protein